MMSRVFGFNADDLAAVRKKATYCPIFKLLEREKGNKTADFCRLLTALRAEARMSTISELVVKILVQTKMDSIFSAVQKDRTAIEMFLQLATAFSFFSAKTTRAFLPALTALSMSAITFVL